VSKFIAEYWWEYLVGLGVALQISVISMAASIVLGTLGALGRDAGSGIVRFIAAAYVAVFRGAPPLLLLYLVYFGLPTIAQSADIPVLNELFSSLNNRIVAAVVAFTLSSGAYSTEIIRAAIAAVGSEQLEAARSIGMSYRLAYRRIILPQAARVAFPPLGNEFITVIKGTSLASVIGVVELMRAAQQAAGATFENLLAYSLAGLYYVALVIVLQLGLSQVERRLKPGWRRAPGRRGSRVATAGART
jgi:His/Glu/Gln/Arg/opine family amino acid ABC transporter permease subunit